MTEEGQQAQPERILHSVKAVIVNGDHQILLVRRSAADRWKSGYWELPGGKVEGDDFEENLLREVSEETGLEVEVLEQIGQFEFTDTSLKTHYPNTIFSNFFYLCQVSDGRLVLSDEHDEFRWITSIDECKEFPLTDASRIALGKYFKQRVIS